jgi:ATP-binding cassette subfamily F protein 3
MAVLIASDLHKDLAGTPLLSGVSFKLERGERMTIAGRNGAGKTTLLRMLSGEESIDRGELSVGKGVRIALHDQRPPREARAGVPLALRDYVLSGCVEELATEAELAELERRMAGDGADERLLERYARAQARLESLGGYLWRDRATVMTRGLGFGEHDLDRPLSSFSGGQLTRASLARVLATGAEVLLLDEPTNHLDIDSLEWLEQTLAGLDAAVVLVAHDRWFLEAVGTSVLELYGNPPVTPTRSRFFAGTWHAWRREQAAREIALGKAIDAQKAEIARMERFIERFRYKATKARQAQSRMKKLAKMERIDASAAGGGKDDRAGLAFSFKAAERSGRVVFELTDARIEVGGEDGSPPLVLLDGAEIWLERGEHVSLVGPNGTGKSTLIETLTGRRALAHGKLSTGHNVTVGYLSQHADELGAGGGGGKGSGGGGRGSGAGGGKDSGGGGGKRSGGGGKGSGAGGGAGGGLGGNGVGGNPNPSVLEAAQHATGLTPNKARALLGRFLFSGPDAEKPLAGLSGGERQRLALAILVNGTPTPPNVLILDEPTNHLDLDSREALEDALRSFQGALILVSHDRALLDAVGSRTVAIEDGSLRSYTGGWPEYVRVREERRDAGGSGGGAVGGAERAGVAKVGAGEASKAGRGAANAGASEAVKADAVGDGQARRGSSSKSAKRRAVKGGAAEVGAAKGGAGGAQATVSKNRQREQQKAERAIEEAETALKVLEDELADPAAWATKYEAAKSEARHTAARRAVEQAYERLAALS